MEAKKTQIQLTQAPKTQLCARSAKRWKERVEWRFWMPATASPPLVSLSLVLRYRSQASSLSSSPTLPSGLNMEVIVQKGVGDKDPDERIERNSENPLLIFVHGSKHAAWCWAKYYNSNCDPCGWLMPIIAFY